MRPSSASVSAFETAVEALYSPLHQAVTREAIQAAAARRTCTVSDMRTYLSRMQWHLPTSTRVVHVTGTKGKGSTAAFCESILRHSYGQTTGLFTSPHLVDIRERIRINGRPVSKPVFGEAYWEVRRRLENYATQDAEGLPYLPGYFRMLTLMALFIFTHYQPAVSVICLEVGMGGRYDSTNVLDLDRLRATACGVTLLDYDHVRVLGNTLEQIAWEKGGIFAVHKADTDRVSPRPDQGPSPDMDSIPPGQETTPRRRFFALDANSDAVLEVLRKCAWIEGRGGELVVVGAKNPRIPLECVLGLPGQHQRGNAELALTLCETVMEDVNHPNEDITPLSFPNKLQALSLVSFPGRCQTIDLARYGFQPNSHLRIDGAHTVESIKAGVDWFRSVHQKHADLSRVLIFYCGHERNPVELLELLLPLSFD